MDELARAAPQDRSAVFRAAAVEFGLPSRFVEKDFWVCWLLRRLFTPPLIEGMVFKGGTSLSKIWNAIQRFSEDIDLTLPQVGLPGAQNIVIRDDQSATLRETLKQQIDEALHAWCSGEGRDEISERIAEALGEKVASRLTASREAVEFEYPSPLRTDQGGAAFVLPRVRLEFGAVMPVVPSEDASLRPYGARAGKYVMADPEVYVRVLAPERTFWEKATLVHAENHRPGPKAAGSRVSRHYADLAALESHEIGTRALQQLDQLRVVAQAKRRYFHAGWAQYEDAADGRLTLVPHAEHRKVLRRDYAGLREMYFSEPLGFDAILERLAQLEKRVSNR